MDLQGQPAEIRFTLTIKRAATGEEEQYEMVGRSLPDQEAKELHHGDDTQHSGEECRD